MMITVTPAMMEMMAFIIMMTIAHIMIYNGTQYDDHTLCTIWKAILSLTHPLAGPKIFTHNHHDYDHCDHHDHCDDYDYCDGEDSDDYEYEDDDNSDDADFDYDLDFDDHED